MGKNGWMPVFVAPNLPLEYFTCSAIFPLWFCSRLIIFRSSGPQVNKNPHPQIISAWLRQFGTLLDIKRGNTRKYKTYKNNLTYTYRFLLLL